MDCLRDVRLRIAWPRSRRGGEERFAKAQPTDKGHVTWYSWKRLFRLFVGPSPQGCIQVK